MGFSSAMVVPPRFPSPILAGTYGATLKVGLRWITKNVEITPLASVNLKCYFFEFLVVSNWANKNAYKLLIYIYIYLKTKMHICICKHIYICV